MRNFNAGMAQSIFVSFFILIIAVRGKAQIWDGRDAMFPYSNSGESVYAISNSVAWTYGVEIDAMLNETMEKNTISRTMDNGLSWESVPLPSDSTYVISSILAFDYDKAFISYVEFPDGPTGQQGDNVVMYTENGGLNWTPVNTPVTTFINFIYMWNALEGIVVGDTDSEGFEIYRTTDGGVSWDRILTGVSTQANEVLYVDNYAVKGNQLWFASNKGKIFHTETKGSSWEVFDSPSTLLGIGLMDVNDQGDVFMFYNTFSANGYHNTLFRRDVNSGEWEIAAEKPSTYMYDIHPVPSSEAIVTTLRMGSNYSTQISYDKGATWSTVNTVDKASYLSFYNPEVGYASQNNTLSDTSTTLMFRYAGSPLVGLIKQTPLLNVDITISPNPIVKEMRIGVMSESAEDYWIILNTFNGELIEKRTFTSASEINCSIDMTSLPAGAYLVRVASKQGVRTEKIIRL